MKIIDKKFRFILPTYIAPRYDPNSKVNTHVSDGEFGIMSSKPAAGGLVYSADVDYKLTFEGNCTMGSKINSITSTTHQDDLTVALVDKTAKIVFRQKEIKMDSDVVILIETADLTSLKVFTDYDAATNSAYLMVHMLPEMKDVQTLNKGEYRFCC